MNNTLSADRPQTDPAQDLFGYAPFAETLTKALCNYGSSDPLVLGLYGAWGSGKSTILKFICHNLEAMPKEERPIVIEFNPWWFSGQEHLARAFLGQLQAVLPDKNEAFKELGEMLGNFSEGIGGLLDLAGITGGMGEKAGALIKTFTERPPKDVPALKKKICDILQLSEKRIVIMIDDIDRLDAEEMRQLFTVIKALADFPNVIYLLAFDIDVVVRAIEKSSGMPGREYLEKIIQAPFVVPEVNRAALVAGLRKRLDEILEGTPEELCKQSYWDSLFYEGIEHFFTVPRDVVRFCNTVTVTYSAVRGEVNAADFIAIEAIRFFLLDLYMYIRDNQYEFICNYDKEQISEQELNSVLTKRVPESFLTCTEKILKILFPYIIKGNRTIGSAIRRGLHIQVLEFAPCYFRFNPSPKTISHAEMMQWLEKGGDAEAFKADLLRANERDPLRGHQRLEKLQDYVRNDVQEKDIYTTVIALLNLADKLHNETSLIKENISILLNRLGLALKLRTIVENINNDRKPDLLGRLYNILESAVASVSDYKDPKVRELIYQAFSMLIRAGRIPGSGWYNLLGSWCEGGHDEEIRNLCIEATKEDAAMFVLIEDLYKFPDLVGQQQIERYIDVADFKRRILALKTEGKIPQEYEKTAESFLEGAASRREGGASKNA